MNLRIRKEEKNGMITLDGYSTSKVRKNILKEIEALVGFNLEDYKTDITFDNFELEILTFDKLDSYWFIKYVL